jgi:SNF2 family DNA or RNA helicase
MSHMLELKRCNVFAEMGLGKSVSTLMAIDMGLRIGDTKPTLIIAPKRVALMTWPMEVEKWSDFNHLEVQPIFGSPADRISRCRNPNAPIFTINYEQIPWLVEHFGSDWPFGRIVADESTRLKSTRIATLTSTKGKEYDKSSGGSSRGRALAEVAFKYSEYFANLTGSPQPNGIQDLWGQCWFIDKGQRLGRSYSSFEDRWFTYQKKNPKSDYSDLVPLPHAKDQIITAISDISIMLRAKDYLDLPPLIENVVYVELPAKARRHYNEIEKKFYTQIDGRPIDAVSAGSKTQKMKQIASGAAYASDQVETDNDVGSSKWVEVHDEKLQALQSIVNEATGENLLVAYHFKSDLARLRKAFPKARMMDDNPQTLRDWNSGLIPMLLAHPACLHPSTEVLTDARGWIRIIDVADDERVFDGVEFVGHKGCSYSGIVPVIDVFGLEMTHEHKLLIDGEWIEAKNIRDTGNIREAARYTYSGNDEYLVKMFTLRSCGNDTVAKREVCDEGQKVYDLVQCGPRSRFLIRNQKGEVFVSHNSAGHGLNLQDGGRTIVYFSPDWNLEFHEQILERIGPTRQAQSEYHRPVFVHFIIARDTVDEVVLERVQTKASMQELFKQDLVKKRLANLFPVC